MSNENSSKVKIISQYFIKPKYNNNNNNNNNVNKHNYPNYNLSSNDLSLLSTPYMHRGLLYAKPPSLTSINSLINNLKNSISIALVDFYPLSGRLSTINYEDENTLSVHVDPGLGPGASLIHASVIDQNEVITLSTVVTCYENISRVIWAFFDLGDPEIVNHDGHTKPLLSIQVTDLGDGLFIGFTMNHVLGDGTSLWLFIKALSQIFMGRGPGDDIIIKPVFKPVFADGFGPVLKLPYSDSSEFITRFGVDPRLRLRVFHFSVGSISRLKTLAGFMWVSVGRARKIPGESDTGCWLIANTRPKYDPVLPPNQFGNFLHIIKVTSKMDDLTRNGLSRATMLVHKGVMGLNDELIRAHLKTGCGSPFVATPFKRDSFCINTPLIFSGSSRFETYGPEFGLGKPVATRTGCSSWMNGKIIVDPGRDGGGSVDLQVCLLSEAMDALECDNEFMSYVS